MSIADEKAVAEGIAPLIDMINYKYKHLDGHYKSVLLKTVTAHYDALVAAEATELLIRKTFESFQN